MLQFIRGSKKAFGAAITALATLAITSELILPNEELPAWWVAAIPLINYLAVYFTPKNTEKKPPNQDRINQLFQPAKERYRPPRRPDL